MVRVKKICAFTPRGEKLWETPIERFSRTGQPVAFAPGGILYYCTGNKLIAISNGEIKWAYELTAGINDTYLTVLDDQSVLVAVLNSVFHISNEGTLTNTFTNPFIITCRPVMDGTGKVYVAGKGAIRCIE